MGRPTKYTPEIEKKICDALADGCTRKAAYGCAGISQPTFLEWLEKYPDFFNSITRAEADAEARFTKAIYKAATSYNSDWRAAESWLKRRRRDEWGDNLSLAKDSDDDLLREAKAILDNQGTGGTGGTETPGADA